MVENSPLRRLFSGGQSTRRSFDVEGAVGLGIVAAMRGGEPTAKSEPIAIVFPGGGARQSMTEIGEDDVMELSESYTCVVSYVGPAAARKTIYSETGRMLSKPIHFSETEESGNSCIGIKSVRKTVYLDGSDGGFFSKPILLSESEESRISCEWVKSVDEHPLPIWPWALPRAEDFLDRCFRCGKKLLGHDIFMYRGEKAFCSTECRCQQMVREEQMETTKSYDCFMSPCSANAPIFFSPGLVVA